MADSVTVAQPDVLPDLELREFIPTDAHAVKEFCLNNLMQRTRLSNQFIYSSPVWLGVYLSVLAWATKTVEPWKKGDWGRWAFLCCAISAMFLVGVDYFTYFHYERKTKRAHAQDAFLQNPSEFVASKHGRCWVAYYDKGLVGVVVLQRREEGHTKKKSRSTDAQVTHWYVRARYRERGLGGDLLHLALQDLKETGCTCVSIQTSSIHKQANKTLAATGFSKTKSAPNDNIYWRMLRIKDNTWSLNPQTVTTREN